MEIYLDHNATTPLDPQVLEVMLPYLRDRFGNASSQHPRGRVAAAAVLNAADQVGALLGVAPSSIVWTSGATEGINMVIKSLRAQGDRNRVLVASTEHKATLEAVTTLRDSGLAIELLPVNRWGLLDLEWLANSLASDVLAVVAMSANNETGTLTPISDVSAMCSEVGALCISDITQSVGKVPIDATAAGIDIAIASAHKFYGPQGVGAVCLSTQAAKRALRPLIHGGGQQHGLRGGTLNLPGIVGMGAAASASSLALASSHASLALLRDELEARLKDSLGGVTVTTGDAPRLPNTSNIRVAGTDAEALIATCPEVAMSTGAACSSSVPTTSHVLRAMGRSDEVASESIRLSLGRTTTSRDVREAVVAITAAARRIREVNS